MCDYTHPAYASVFEAAYWPKKLYYYFAHGPVKSLFSGKVSYRCFYYGKLPLSLTENRGSLSNEYFIKTPLAILRNTGADLALFHEVGYQTYWPGIKRGSYIYLEDEEGGFITFDNLDEFRTLYPHRYSTYSAYDEFVKSVDGGYSLISSRPFPGITFSL
jgi:hypothetical protein